MSGDLCASAPPAGTELVGHLTSLNVGLPQEVSWGDRVVLTGIFKSPVTGPTMVRRLNIDGDGQGDLGGHGGEQRAVLVYQNESYRYWAHHLGRDDLRPGMFGENFTVEGLADEDVCIGDRYRIGEAEFEVTQPRVTCFRVGMRLGQPDMAALLVSHRRPGFYMRVITEGRVRAGDPIMRTRSGPHRVSVAALDALLYLPDRDRALLPVALDLPALSPGWRQSFEQMLHEDPAAPAPDVKEALWTGFRSATVTRLVPETEGILSVWLSLPEPVSQAPIPGQYLTLRVAPSAIGSAVRSYSISAVPDASTYRISVRRDPSGLVSDWVHRSLRAGSSVEIAAPRGEFTLTRAERPVVLCSAGVGITPVLAMLRSLAEARATVPVWWLHVCRGETDYPFLDEIREHLRALSDVLPVTFVTGTTGPSGPIDLPDSLMFAGRPTREALTRLRIPSDARAYICGPAGFNRDMAALLAAVGLLPENIHFEMFSALSPINPGVVANHTGAPHPPAGGSGAGPSVTFARSGLTVRWRSTDRSLLELAEACEVPTRWACRSGVCHTCSTGLINGAVRTNPNPLERPAAGQVLVCCSLPTEDVVLDM